MLFLLITENKLFRVQVLLVRFPNLYSDLKYIIIACFALISMAFTTCLRCKIKINTIIFGFTVTFVSELRITTKHIELLLNIGLHVLPQEKNKKNKNRYLYVAANRTSSHIVSSNLSCANLVAYMSTFPDMFKIVETMSTVIVFYNS